MPKTAKIDVKKVIELHAVIPDSELALLDVHSHGLEKYGHQNFQVFAPPLYYHSAGNLLNSLADAVINKGEKFKAKENCEWGEWGRFTLEDEKDEETGEVLLRIIPVMPDCACCEGDD